MDYAMVCTKGSLGRWWRPCLNLVQAVVDTVGPPYLGGCLWVRVHWPGVNVLDLEFVLHVDRHGAIIAIFCAKKYGGC